MQVLTTKLYHQVLMSLAFVSLLIFICVGDCWKNRLLSYFWHNFSWDPWIKFGRSKLIHIFLHESIEIIYLLAKSDKWMNEKLEFKVDRWKIVYGGGKTIFKFVPHKKFMKALTTLYMAIHWNGVIKCSIKAFSMYTHKGTNQGSK